MKNMRALLTALPLVLVVVLNLFSLERPSYAPFDHKLTKKQEKWVRQTLAVLSLDEKIGQMITVNTNAVFMNRESDEFKQLRRRVVENKIGGLILSRSEVWASAILTNRLQEMSKVPLLVSADLEMGPGMRLDDTTWWAPNMAVAATGDVKYARLQGTYTAREARAAGINWLYAPVADVNNNPDNPVINTRSYGEDPKMVAAFTSAFIEGAQAAGALATAKHFPGHGDTAIDSHIGLPVVDVTKQRLEQLELVPFRAAIASGVGSIMTAHIALPQIEPEQAAPPRVRASDGSDLRVTLPATLSHRILTGLLRDELKFNGLVVTDAMEMAGIAARYDASSSAVLAVQAGADMILKTPDLDAAIRAIKQAVEHGEITEPRINASVERILRAKAALGLSERRTVNVQEVDQVVSDPEYNVVAQEIAERSITLVRDQRKVLPIRGPQLLSVVFSDEENRSITQPFIAQLRHGGMRVDTMMLDARSLDSEFERAAAEAGNARAVVYSIFARGTLPPVAVRLANELSKIKVPAVVISFGSPYMLAAMPDIPVYIAAYSPYPVSQRAAARALLGEIPFNGKLPVTLPGLYPRGHGL